MLDYLRLKNVGPAAEMSIELATRLNLITGDNGLGKTLLLDCAWYALTGIWPATWGGRGVIPSGDGASIEWAGQRGFVSVEGLSKYQFDAAQWKIQSFAEAPRSARGEGALVVYMRVDGGISVYDPLRAGDEFKLSTHVPAWGQSNVFQFREADIWDGIEPRDLFGPRSVRATEGLVRDVSRWAVESENADFARLAELVGALSCDETFHLLRKVKRVYVDDPRDYPVLSGPFGELPVVHAPAGLRRILGLAYVVVWAWREHHLAAQLKRKAPNTALVLLIDEVEVHLHPKWQRTILPALLRALAPEGLLQVIASTHSPMVLASMEASFDSAKDAWFDFDLNSKSRQVEVSRKTYVPHGEIGNWLTSEAFDLKEPRSLEGETAIRAALELTKETDPALERVEATDAALHRAGLSDIDRFWVRWGYFVDQQRAKALVDRQKATGHGDQAGLAAATPDAGGPKRKGGKK